MSLPERPFATRQGRPASLTRTKLTRAVGECAREAAAVGVKAKRRQAPPPYNSGRNRCRSGDLTLFRRALYQLSYPTKANPPPPEHPNGDECLADLTGFEPATSGLTGRRALLAAPQVRVAAGNPSTAHQRFNRGIRRRFRTTPPRARVTHSRRLPASLGE
jgi:hypothetical protein